MMVLAVAVSAALGQAATVFKVFANQGPTEVRSGGNPSALKIGASLKAGDVLVLAEGCYVALIHNTSGKPQELRKAGSYTVADLEKGLTGNSGLVTKYTEFILSSNSEEAKKNRLSATGAVHRGLNDIDLFLPEARTKMNQIIGDSVLLSWESKSSKEGPYEVQVKDLYDKVLLTVPSSTNKVKIKVPKTSDFAVNVVVRRQGENGPGSGTFIIKTANPGNPKDNELARQVKSELAEMNLGDATALNKYILAGFYEQKNLLIDAIWAYEQAVQLAPDVDTYKEAYHEFLLRKQLKDAKP